MLTAVLGALVLAVASLVVVSLQLREQRKLLRRAQLGPAYEKMLEAMSWRSGAAPGHDVERAIAIAGRTLTVWGSSQAVGDFVVWARDWQTLQRDAVRQGATGNLGRLVGLADLVRKEMGHDGEAVSQDDLMSLMMFALTGQDSRQAT